MNMVAGHSPKEFRYYGDLLNPEERYDRTDEFLTICRKFWESDTPVNYSGKYYAIENGTLNTPFVSEQHNAPEIYLGGKSDRAFELAAKHASCLLTMPDSPPVLKKKIQSLLATGTECGILVSLIARPTRSEALTAAEQLIAPLGEQSLQAHKNFVKNSVSEAFNSVLKVGQKEEDWLHPNLWVGAVPYLGAPAIALVGSYEEVADTIMDYKEIGISQMLFMGWPDMAEMTHFASGVLPYVRQKEDKLMKNYQTVDQI